MAGRAAALHDLSKNADNQTVTQVTFTAPQHAALQIQRKCRRLCGAILPHRSLDFPAFFMLRRIVF
jgi:hypothetical protein